MNLSKRILLVDDEPDIIELVSYNLVKEGFEISSASDGEHALNKIHKENFDLIILDLMLPRIHGMELCRILRNNQKTKNLPILMLTAKSEEVDKVLGLEMGADDYITKPFSPRELVARVKAILRRLDRTEQESVKEKTIKIGNLSIDLEKYEVKKGNTLLNLSATEFKLLLFLAERRGRVFSREQLLDSVWGNDSFVEPRTVDVHVRRLREQIEDNPADPRYIKTRRGIGYYMDAEI